MGKNLLRAQLAFAMKREATNGEKVLAEIIQMTETQKEFTSKELTSVIISRLGISIALYRKTIFDLRKAGLIKKDKLKYSLV